MRRTRLMGFGLILTAVACSLLLSTHADAQAQGTGSFTIASAGAPNGQVVPTLTWTTSPAGATCAASGDTAWTGTKAGNGTLALPAVTPPRSYALTCNWPGGDTAALTWVAPTTNTDNTPLVKCAASTDTGPCLAKYRIYRGNDAVTMSEVRDHNFPNATSSTWTGLPAGTHFFGIKAVTGQGAESALSNVVSKTIVAPMQWTASVGVKVPSAATGLAVN